MECTGDFAGEYCDQPITCENGTAKAGIEGDGKCSECEEGYYGSNCSYDEPCRNGVLSSDAFGSCLVCSGNFFGEICDERTPGCANGLSVGGPQSDGTCSECDEGFDGPNCDQCAEGHYGSKCQCITDGHFGESCRVCSCFHGTCNDGLEGDGQCSACDEGFEGPDCTTCKNGGYGSDCKAYGSVTDLAGNSYKTVEIGDQTWMAENYRRPIGTYTDAGEEYGLFYALDTAKSEGFCPEGWHLPSRADIEILLDYVSEHQTSVDRECIYYTDEIAYTHPAVCDLALNAHSDLWTLYRGKDEFGFAALPAGYYSVSNSTVKNRGTAAHFWIDAENRCFHLSDTRDLYYTISLQGYGADASNYQNTVRCVKDAPYPDEQRYGKDFIPCSCLHGTCNRGLLGDGKCTTDESGEPICEEGWLGENCDVCANGGYGLDCKPYGSVTINNITYKTVEIGDQTWMAENMRDDLAGTENANKVLVPEQAADYGLLYGYAAAEALCGEGWRLPTTWDVKKLFDYVAEHRTSPSDSSALQARSPLWQWGSKYQGRTAYPGTDEFGFGALPAGLVSYQSDGAMTGVGRETGFWEMYTDDMNRKQSATFGVQIDSVTKKYMRYKTSEYLSVRCIKKTECPADRWGESCEKPCLCVHGLCDSSNGLCTKDAGGEPLCEEGWGGNDCNACANGGYGPDCTAYGTVTDQDGHVYQTVQIGDQIWMASNYDRDVGENVTDQEKNKLEGDYGRLYDKETVNAEGFCPDGWHLPWSGEIQKMLDYVAEHRTSESDYLALADQASTGIWEWNQYEYRGNNEFGFSAKLRKPLNTSVNALSYKAAEYKFWAYASDKSLRIRTKDVSLGTHDTPSSDLKYSVRCIKDATP